MPGDSRVLGAGTSGTLVAIATNSPVAVGSGMVNTAQQLEDLPVVKDAWAQGAISGLHVHQILTASPGSLPGRQPAVVALATRPPTFAGGAPGVADRARRPRPTDRLFVTVEQQRAKRSLRLSARANGMWAVSGRPRRGQQADGLAETLASFTRLPDTHDSTTPAQRRADAPGRHGRQRPPATAQVRWQPGGFENLAGEGACLTDGTPLGGA